MNRIAAFVVFVVVVAGGWLVLTQLAIPAGQVALGRAAQANVVPTPVPDPLVKMAAERVQRANNTLIVSEYDYAAAQLNFEATKTAQRTSQVGQPTSVPGAGQAPVAQALAAATPTAAPAPPAAPAVVAPAGNPGVCNKATGIASGPAIVEINGAAVKVNSGKNYTFGKGECWILNSQPELEARWPQHVAEFRAKHPGLPVYEA